MVSKLRILWKQMVPDWSGVLGQQRASETKAQYACEKADEHTESAAGKYQQRYETQIEKATKKREKHRKHE